MTQPEKNIDVGHTLKELPPIVHSYMSEADQMIDAIIAANGEWVVVRKCGGSSASSTRTSLEMHANRRRIFIDTSARKDGANHLVLARLVRIPPNA